MYSNLCTIDVYVTNVNSNSIDFLFNIDNNTDDLNIKSTFIIPIHSDSQPILIANFILTIKSGLTQETLHLEWNKLDVKLNKINKIQFAFATFKENIVSNIIDIN